MRSFFRLVIFIAWAVSGIAQSSAANTVVAFGLSDQLPVFDSEARIGAAILRQYYAPNARAIVRTNTPTNAGATEPMIASAIRTAARNMDRENDLLILFFTSHGSKQGISLSHGNDYSPLGIADLKFLLGIAAVKNKVVIISSCYSGNFTELADPHTLVITASDAKHSSFGCTERAKLTYFGELFFSDAIPKTSSLVNAYHLLRTETKQLEDALCSDKEIHFCGHSNPQIAGGQDLGDRINATGN